MHHYAATFHPDELAAVAPRIADIHAIKTRHFAEIIASGAVRPRPGVRGLMDEARRVGLRLAIATTMSRPSLDVLLPPILAPDCYTWFAAIATGDRVAKKKPAPDLYLLALEELCIAASDALAIEDSAIGLQAARAAGIATLITPSTYTADDDFVGAEIILVDLEQISGNIVEVLSTFGHYSGT